LYIEAKQNKAGLLDAVFDNLFDAVAVVDGETGRFIGANSEAIELLGYQPDELRRLRPDDIHPHEIPRLRDFMTTIRAKGRWVSGDLSCRRKCGMLVPAEIRATRTHDDGHELIVIVIRDRRVDQLADLGRSIRKIAHDLRNTLATAQLLSDSLLGHSDDRVRRNAETINRAIERALLMSRQTLSAGRSSTPAPDYQRFLLLDVVDELRNSLGVEAGRDAVSLRDDAGDTILDADFDQIYRILLNLSRNAFDAGAKTITISCKRREDALSIIVADDGPGLPQDMVDQLFDEKLRSHSGKTGLGLMISQELAQNHGGALRLRSTSAQGTTFELGLPVTPAR
jgi:PAS domain S-box-containing protein